MGNAKNRCFNCDNPVKEHLKYCPYCGEKQPSPLSESDISKNPYKILQVSEDAEPEVIEAAYKSLSKKYHPDIDSSHDAEEKMKDINWAFDMLSDSLKRKQWDRGVKAKPKPKPKHERPAPKQDFQRESPIRETKTTWRTPEDIEIKKPSHRKGINPGTMLVGIIIFACVFLLVRLVNNHEPNSGSANIASTKRISTKAPKYRPTHTPVIYATKMPCIHHDRVNQGHLGKLICVYGSIMSVEYQGFGFVIRFWTTGKENFLINNERWDLLRPKQGDCIEVYGYVRTNNVYYYINPGADGIAYSTMCN